MVVVVSWCFRPVCSPVTVFRSWIELLELELQFHVHRLKFSRVLGWAVATVAGIVEEDDRCCCVLAGGRSRERESCSQAQLRVAAVARIESQQLTNGKGGCIEVLWSWPELVTGAGNWGEGRRVAGVLHDPVPDPFPTRF